MAETRWVITDPQNRIRRLQQVADGTVNVEIVLPTDDPTSVAAVERAARDAGIEIVRAAAAVEAFRMPLPVAHSVVVNGVEYVPAAGGRPVLPS